MGTQAETVSREPMAGATARRARHGLPRRWARRLVTVVAVLVGAALGVIYARKVSTESTWLTLGVGGIGGAFLGYLAVAIPRLALHFLLREWYRTIANHWRALLRQRAERARRLLQQQDPDTQTLIDLGVAHYLRGAYADAAKCLTSARREDEPSTGLLNALAAAEAAETRWEEAAGALGEALLQQPDDALSLDNLATLLATMPAHAELPSSLEDVLQAAGARALNNMAVRHMQLGDPAAARISLQMALARQPLYPHAQANLGVLSFRDGDTQTAVINLAAAAQFASSDADILASLGAVLAVRENYSAADRTLKRAIRLDARQAAAIVNEGCICVRQGRYEEAIQLFHDVPHDDPLLGLAWHNAAVACEATKDYRLAREYEEKAASLRPDDGDILSNLGAIEWRLGNYDEADAHFQRASEVAPGNVAAAANAARAATAVGRYDEGLAIIRRLQEGRHYDIELVFDLGVTQLMVSLGRRKQNMNRTEQDLFDSALRASIAAFEKNLTDKGGIAAESRFNLGLAYYLKGEPEIAAQHFEQAMKLLGEDSQTHFCAGTAFAEAADRLQQDRAVTPDELVPEVRQLFRRARAHLEKAAADVNATADVFANLGMVCYELGDVDDATKALRRLVQMENSVAANNSLALAFAKQGQEFAHQFHIKRTAGQSGADTMGKARQLISTAIHYFSQALKVEPKNPVLHRNIGLAYMLRNNPEDMEKALNHWQLMRQAGDEWAERQFASMMQVMQTQQSAKAEFHDAGRALRQIPAFKYIRRLPPVMGRPLFVVEPVMDHGQWELKATHPDLRVALRARSKLLRINERLQRLVV